MRISEKKTVYLLNQHNMKLACGCAKISAQELDMYQIPENNERIELMNNLRT